MEKIKELIKTPAFWVIVVLILFGIFALVILSQEEKKGYLLLSNISSYTCSKKECTLIENKELAEKENLGNFNVYESNKNSGTYKVKFINKWNFFDTNNNYATLSDNFIAGSTNLDLKVEDFDIREMSNEELSILNKHLKENKIEGYSLLEVNQVLEYDFNKDEKKEKILLASNVNDETEDEKLFAIVISIVNNKSSVLHIDIYNQYENFEVPTYRIKGIINLFNQKEDYLVLLKGFFSEVGTPTTYIYKQSKNSFENIINSK